MLLFYKGLLCLVGSIMEKSPVFLGASGFPLGPESSESFQSPESHNWQWVLPRQEYDQCGTAVLSGDLVTSW